MKISKLFDKPKIISIVGDVNEAKSNLLYHIIAELKKENKFKLYTYGLRNKIPGAQEVFSVEELEQTRDSINIIDEVMSLWDLDNRKAKRIIEKSLRLINHNNNILVISGVPDNFRKFIAGKVDLVMYKKCTISDFVNGSKTKNILMNYKGSELGSSVFNIKKGEVLIYDGVHYNKVEVPYYKRYDTKLNNVPIIVKKNGNKNVQKKDNSITKEVIEAYKEEYCETCDNKHSCSDLDGDLIDEQVRICLENNPSNAVRQAAII